VTQDSPTADIAAWNDRFSVDEYIFGKDPNAFLAREVGRLRPGGKVLCVADGESRNGVWLAERGFRVHAIDGSEVALKKSKALARERGVHINGAAGAKPGIYHELVNVDTWQWPHATYDAVVAIFIQFATAEIRPALFTNIASSLVDGGLLLLEGYGTKQLRYGTGGPTNLEQLYTTGLLSKSFPTMRIEALTEYDQEIDEGDRHKGMSALIDLVATKI
jgi:cyclopropane fatty-acyl-phospholipid synthase-like methyltransferase